MFEKIDYVIDRIDGDYAYLRRLDRTGEELKCLARALLPPEIMEGSRLAYEMMEYKLTEA
ncbi:chorismate--pyruvate lyase [Clostridium sp. AF15-17LB]|nr:chorismate--pyruvate lyase [Clostridium sp. AF15-17LB]